MENKKIYRINTNAGQLIATVDEEQTIRFYDDYACLKNAGTEIQNLTFAEIEDDSSWETVEDMSFGDFVGDAEIVEEAEIQL